MATRAERALGLWRALAREQRTAGVAALGLLVTMALPWYELQSLEARTNRLTTTSISAFGDVSFVEAAVFLVSAGVLALLYARASGRAFHLPGGDGTVVAAAGAWATFLIFYRVFDRPAGNGYPVGIQWGFFVAFVAAGALALSGLRLRAAHVAEPTLGGVDLTGRHEAATSVARPSPADGPEPATGATAAQRAAQRAARRPRPASDEALTVVDPSDATTSTRVVPRRPEPGDGEQLTFDDA